MERRLSLSIAAIGVATATVWIGVAGMRTPPARQIDSALGDLEMTVRETAAGTHARAVTLSQLPRLSWAVATDEATVRDLTGEELAFRPQPGESIEIAQVPRIGGGVHRLINIPVDGKPALIVSEPGLHLVGDGDEVRVTAVMKIEPRERAKIESGLVGVAQRLDLSRVSKHLEAMGISAQLETSNGSATISTGRSRGRMGTTTLALQSPAADGAKLVLKVPQGIAWGHVSGALFALFASLLAAKLVARRARDGRAPAELSQPLKVRSTDEWSDETDDPTLVGPESNVLASTNGVIITSSGSHDLLRSRSGDGRKRPLDLSGPVFPGGVSMTIPSSLFVAGDAASADSHPPALPGPDSPWTAEYRRLFSEFVKLRRTCSESTDDLDRDRFIVALHQKRLQLMEENDGNVDVKFRLAFDNGKAAVRFKVQSAAAIKPAPARDHGN